MWYSSKQGKKDPKDNLEIVKASSFGIKSWEYITWILTDQIILDRERKSTFTMGAMLPKLWRSSPCPAEPSEMSALPRYQGMEPSRDVGTQPRQKTTERMRLLQRIPARKMPSGAMWIRLLPMIPSQQSPWCAVPDRDGWASMQVKPVRIAMWVGFQQSHGGRYTPGCIESYFHIPVGLAGRVSDERLFSGLGDSMFALLGLDLLGTCHPLLSYFSRLGEFALLPVPHSILKHIIFFFISQIHIWRAIYLRINYTLSLMHI